MAYSCLLVEVQRDDIESKKFRKSITTTWFPETAAARCDWNLKWRQNCHLKNVTWKGVALKLTKTMAFNWALTFSFRFYSKTLSKATSFYKKWIYKNVRLGKINEYKMALYKG